MWISANVKKWEKEKPEWWTNKLIQKIPAQVLSKEQMTMLVSKGKKSRRKSSMLEDADIV